MGTIIVAIVGVLGTLFGPIIQHRELARLEKEKWMRKRKDEIFEHRRALYRRFVAYATVCYAKMKKGDVDMWEDFANLAGVHAEIELTCPDRVIEASTAVKDVFRKIASGDSDMQELDQDWHKEVEGFTKRARSDLGGGPMRICG